MNEDNLKMLLWAVPVALILPIFKDGIAIDILFIIFIILKWIRNVNINKVYKPSEPEMVTGTDDVRNAILDENGNLIRYSRFSTEEIEENKACMIEGDTIDEDGVITSKEHEKLCCRTNGIGVGDPVWYYAWSDSLPGREERVEALKKKLSKEYVDTLKNVYGQIVIFDNDFEDWQKGWSREKPYPHISETRLCKAYELNEIRARYNEYNKLACDGKPYGTRKYGTKNTKSREHVAQYILDCRTPSMRGQMYTET